MKKIHLPIRWAITPYIAIGLVFGGFCCGYAQDPQTTVSSKSIPEQLQNFERLSVDQRGQLIRDVKKNSEDTLFLLEDKLNSPNVQVAANAAYFLGEQRSKHAATFLAQKITLFDDATYIKGSRLWYWSQYPCADALTKIGLPAVPLMLENLAEKKDRKVRILSLWVLTRVDSGHPDKELAEFFLQRTIKNEKDADRKANLLEAAKSLAADEQEKLE